MIIVIMGFMALANWFVENAPTSRVAGILFIPGLLIVFALVGIVLTIIKNLYEDV